MKNHPEMPLDAIRPQIIEIKATFSQEIAAATTARRLPREGIDRLLAAVALADIASEAVPHAFDELARRFAALRDTLQQQTNDHPEIAALRDQARGAVTRSDLNEVERALTTMREWHGILLQRWHRENGAPAGQIAIREGEAETCAQQAVAALMRFDVVEALKFYRDGIELLVPRSPDDRHRYTIRAGMSLRDFGKRLAHTDALLAALEMYQLALGIADPQTEPVDSATVQENVRGDRSHPRRDLGPLVVTI